MKAALELFCGTKSVGKSLQKFGFHVDSLDIDPKVNATWTCDILTWDYKQIESGTYDYTHASCPCTEYSIARTTAKTPRNLELADSIVAKTLEIVKYLQPTCYTLENPQTGLLKTRDVIQGIPFVDVTYCKYSDGANHTYRKATRLWGYLPMFRPREICTRKSPCTFSAETGKRPRIAQRGDGFSQDQLYSMPEQLCHDMAKAAALMVTLAQIVPGNDHLHS
jgi:hypothetical protein